VYVHAPVHKSAVGSRIIMTEVQLLTNFVSQ